MQFLEKTRRERHKIGPEEIQDWKQEVNVGEAGESLARIQASVTENPR